MSIISSVTHEACPDHLAKHHLDTMQEKGYLAFEEVLSPGEVARARADISESIRRLASDPQLAERTSGNEHIGAGFRSRQSPFSFQLEAGFEPDTGNLEDLELHVRKLWAFQRETPGFESLAFTHPKLRAVREALLGADPVLFQSMALIKPPHVGREKPWHQDNAYFSVTPLDAVLGVWIALDDATVANGCMHVLEGGHRAGPRCHHHTFDCEIVGSHLDTSGAVPVELRAGGAMFFYGMLPHQTPANSSPERRRALQYHYRSRDSVITDEETYNRVFAEDDGTPASCAFARTHGGAGI